MAEIRAEAYQGERLVVCHNPLPGEYPRRKRENLVAATEEDLAKIAREVARRTKTPLLAPQIAEKVGPSLEPVLGQALRAGDRGRGFEYARRTAASPGRRNWTGSTSSAPAHPSCGCRHADVRAATTWLRAFRS